MIASRCPLVDFDRVMGQGLPAVINGHSGLDHLDVQTFQRHVAYRRKGCGRQSAYGLGLVAVPSVPDVDHVNVVAGFSQPEAVTESAPVVFALQGTDEFVIVVQVIKDRSVERFSRSACRLDFDLDHWLGSDALRTPRDPILRREQMSVPADVVVIGPVIVNACPGDDGLFRRGASQAGRRGNLRRISQARAGFGWGPRRLAPNFGAEQPIEQSHVVILLVVAAQVYRHGAAVVAPSEDAA